MFTQNNTTAYAISRRFRACHYPPNKAKERSHLLEGFGDGTYGVLATSKVLNEGVDVPAANVAIVMSGSGSVREHVQRAGRILRQGENKKATLYELVFAGTAEQFTSNDDENIMLTVDLVRAYLKKGVLRSAICEVGVEPRRRKSLRVTSM